MIKFLFIFSFLIAVQIVSIETTKKCSTTRCYHHFSSSQCPKNTFAVSWHFCALVFGRYETCCSESNLFVSPRVKSFRWGRVEVEGTNEIFKDVKLFPGGAKSWDWRETNTRHQPGIQPADLNDLFEKNCQVVILSRGIENQLNTKNETRDELERRGMKFDQDFFILQSDEAVRLYNQFVDQQKRVCAVIHSTC